MADMTKSKGRPNAGYRLADGTRVPRVTTITGRFKDSSALLAWANREGLEGRTIDRTRDRAADVGTAVHEWILQDIPIPHQDLTPNQVKQLQNCIKAWEQFREGREWETVLVEEPMVSERWRFGGRLDALWNMDGALTLFDLKTSGGLYPEMLLQLGAYWQLSSEHGYRVDRALIVRLDKRDATFDARWFDAENLAAGWRMFSHLLDAYRAERAVKKAFGG